MFKAVTLIVRFVLELILLFSLGYWGFHLKGSFFLQFVVGLGLPVAAAIVWGLFISPKASGRVPLFAVLHGGGFVRGGGTLSHPIGFYCFCGHFCRICGHQPFYCFEMEHAGVLIPKC